jgi:hypothetical protein
MDMQKRLVEELAECRGGPNRLKKMRVEFADQYNELEREMEEVREVLELIDEVTGDGEQEATTQVTDREPVDSIGE